MANLPENAAAFPGVYQIETSDPVVGGPPDPATGAGMSNIPHKQLADRTAWLRAALLALNLDKVVDTATRVAMTVTERAKLSGIATGATRNATDAQLRDRATHTGAQAIATVSGLQAALDAKAAGSAFEALAQVAITTANSPRLFDAVGHFQFGPGGLILQWGSSPLQAAPTPITFRRRFPTACLGVVVSDRAAEAIASRANPAAVHGTSVTTSGFTAFAQSASDPTQFAASGITWLALGH